MNKTSFWVLIVVIIIVVGGAWYYESSKMAGAPAVANGTDQAAGTFGTYNYECDEHVTFAMTPSSDMSTITIAPIGAGTFPATTTLSEGTASSGSLYEGGGYTFAGKGESVTLTSNGSTLNCSPVSVPDEAPFNFGD